MEKLTLSVDEMAALLGISRPKAYELVHTPGFPVLQVGRRLRVPTSALLAWVEEQAVHREA